MINADFIMQVIQVPCPKVFIGLIDRNSESPVQTGLYTSHSKLITITLCTVFINTNITTGQTGLSSNI